MPGNVSLLQPFAHTLMTQLKVLHYKYFTGQFISQDLLIQHNSELMIQTCWAQPLFSCTPADRKSTFLTTRPSLRLVPSQQLSFLVCKSGVSLSDHVMQHSFSTKQSLFGGAVQILTLTPSSLYSTATARFLFSHTTPLFYHAHQHLHLPCLYSLSFLRLLRLIFLHPLQSRR